jgi:hypothetical protein
MAASYMMPDVPAYLDERLDDLNILARYYQQKYMDADFEDDPLVDNYKSLMLHYRNLISKGALYEPKF